MTDTLLLAIRWVHAIAAVAWVGGGIFFWVVLRPAIRTGQLPSDAIRLVGIEFGRLVILAMWTLVITGGVLMFSRLSEPSATVSYVAVLGAKIALSAWMFFLAVGRRRPTPAARPAGRIRAAANALGHVNMTVLIGVIVFGLSDILRFLVERELAE